jgi:AAA ATPase domain
LTANSTKLKSLQRALVLNKLDSLLVELDEAIQMFCAGVSYLEPLRATAQRFYRREEVSIDELDPKGLNTTFFLQGLTARERESLNSWLRETFGFSLTVKTAGGHSSLNIETDSGGQSRNMADVGLGYSQITPVAIQLWAATRRLTNRSMVARVRNASGQILRDAGAVVVVEQPELHLHPAYQAKLADVFTGCVRNPAEADTSILRRTTLRILAETHSPNLINRLGEIINEGKLLPEDVQILVFEPDSKQAMATSIRTATFNDKGVLQNWPIGFFEY